VGRGRTPGDLLEERAKVTRALETLAAFDVKHFNDAVVVVKPGRANKRPAPEGRTPRPTPGHRRIEWVGEPSPFDNPNVALKLACGHYTRVQAETIRAYHRKRIRRTPGHNREMTKDRDGMTQDWVWGPKAGTYVRLLPNRDADRLLSGPSGSEFRDLDAGGVPSPVILPNTDIRLMREAEFDSYAINRGTRRGEFHVAGTGPGDD
jgi:hypothetical protein